QLATGERGGGVVLASQRVEAVMGRQTRVRRPWAKVSSRLWTKACTSRRGGGSVGRWVASRRLDGVHMMNGLDLHMEGSLVTETKTKAFEEKWMWDEDGFVDNGRGRLASCGLCDQRRLAASTDLECARRCRRDEWLGSGQGRPDDGGSDDSGRWLVVLFNDVVRR
ncbi:hypothetical protein ACLOJK_024142, partial [Asimina triloba]